jgi:hypothetical protein
MDSNAWTLHGMGGFVLRQKGCRIFPVVLGAKLDDHTIMEPAHFKFKTFYPVERIGESDWLDTSIRYRTVSEAEIRDRGKGDSLGKPVVLF